MYYIKSLIYLFLKKTSYSQDGEDKLIIEYFNFKKEGFFIDIGCHHPKRFSNTYLLHKRGWSGINIDANPWTIFLFNIFRRNDINLCTVVSTNSNPVFFYEFEDSALNGLHTENAIDELYNNGYVVKKKRKVVPTSLKSILVKHITKGKKIDLFKIDVEGLDFKLLKSIDLNNFSIDLLMVEKGNEFETKELIDYLKSKNFLKWHESERNLIFKHNPKFNG